MAPRDKAGKAEELAGDPADRPTDPVEASSEAPPAPAERQPKASAAAGADPLTIRLHNVLTGEQLDVAPTQYEANRAMWNAQGYHAPGE